jgi:cell shape-determining protein MreC
MSTPLKVATFFVILILILYFIFPVFISSIFLFFAKPLWSINAEDKSNMSLLSLETQNIIISQLQKENKELKEILGRNDTKNRVLAYILKKPPFTAYDSFIIDVGKDQNIQVGNKVYSVDNILVGEVAEVVDNISKVKIFSSYDEKYDVFIGEKNIQAKAIGKGGGMFEVVIPRDVIIKEGDTVTIPDISNSVFGIVNKIIRDPARAFSTVIFSMPINIYEQKWLLVHVDK